MPWVRRGNAGRKPRAGRRGEASRPDGRRSGKRMSLRPEGRGRGRRPSRTGAELEHLVANCDVVPPGVPGPGRRVAWQRLSRRA